jgi:hypothetical protein
MQAVTTKLVFVVSKDSVLTIHRGILAPIEEKKEACNYKTLTLGYLVRRLCSRVILSYEKPLDELESRADISSKAGCSRCNDAIFCAKVTLLNGALRPTVRFLNSPPMC